MDIERVSGGSLESDLPAGFVFYTICQGQDYLQRAQAIADATSLGIWVRVPRQNSSPSPDAAPSIYVKGLNSANFGNVLTADLHYLKERISAQLSAPQEPLSEFLIRAKLP